MRLTPSPFERGDQRGRELLEQHLVARAAHALAGRRFGGAEDAHLDARRLHHPHERRGDLLPARIERLRGADVEQVVERRDLLRAAHDRHAELLRPGAARVGGEAPGIALHLVGVEDGLQLVRERAVHQHPLLAHPVELREVLELDRARGLAVAAGRAGPQRVLADHLADQRRQRVRGGGSGENGVALVQQVVLEAVVDPLQRQRLAGEERRAGVLAAAALGAGEGVEPVLPAEVLRRAHAQRACRRRRRPRP